MKTIENIVSDKEREFYGLQDTRLANCSFEGEADGESALKESRNIVVANSKFILRYPLWHCNTANIENCFFGDTCRAPIWYSSGIVLSECEIAGVKAVRECDDVTLCRCNIDSEEFAWYSRNIKIDNCDIKSIYILMGSHDFSITNSTISSKYSFQYTSGVTVTDSELNTKDAFWHSKNAVVKNCKINGEYLGWYSENLTLENCEISGTQPFCYATGLKLVNCTMTGCDLAFEYSDVTADIKGGIDSVKNPKSGLITADSIGEIIKENAVYDCNCEIKIR